MPNAWCYEIYFLTISDKILNRLSFDTQFTIRFFNNSMPKGFFKPANKTVKVTYDFKLIHLFSTKYVIVLSYTEGNAM